MIYRIATCAPTATHDVATKMFMHTYDPEYPGMVVAPAYHMVVRVGRNRKRKRVVRFVLPGFVFVYEHEAEGLIEALWDLETAPVRWLKTIGEGDRPFCVCDQEDLLPISRYAHDRSKSYRETGGAPSERSQEPLPQIPVGSRVRLTEGPFSGFEGVLLRKGSPGSFDPLWTVECEKIGSKIRCSPFFLEKMEL